MASYQEEQKHSEISSSIPDQVVETSLNDPSLVITQHSASPDKTTATNDEQNEIMPEQQLCSNLDDKVVNAVTVVDIDKKELEDNSSSEPTSDTSGKKEQQELKQSIQQDQNTSDASASNNHQQHEEIEQNDKYYVKWIEFNTELVPILLQNANGPCPLLAIMNVLLLRQKICINADICILSAEQILAYLVDFLFQCVPKNIPDEEHLNYEQNINDAMAVLDKLKTGLDVNVKFDRVHKFEYTRECVIFDLLGIQLLHGWLIDPQDDELLSIIGDCGYNQLVEKIISQRQSDKEELIRESLLIEEFLENNASQLTYHGLIELNQTMRDNQLAVLFRNNHFSTIYKQHDHLLVLVTDQGFLNQPDIVWETLTNIDGDSIFCDAYFRIFKKQTETEQQDYQMALALHDEEEQLYNEAHIHSKDVNQRPQQQQQHPPPKHGQQPHSSQPQGDVSDKKHNSKKKQKEQLEKESDSFCTLC